MGEGRVTREAGSGNGRSVKRIDSEVVETHLRCLVVMNFQSPIGFLRQSVDLNWRSGSREGSDGWKAMSLGTTLVAMLRDRAEPTRGCGYCLWVGKLAELRDRGRGWS
jgi:hypothetical protein